MLLSVEVAAAALTVSDVSNRFVSWVVTECLEISQKKNCLALYNSFLLKCGGASQSVLLHMKKSFGYSFIGGSLLCLGDWCIGQLQIVIFENPRLHWIDNYAKTSEKEQFRKIIWTDHGLMKPPFVM